MLMYPKENLPLFGFLDNLFVYPQYLPNMLLGAMIFDSLFPRVLTYLFKITNVFLYDQQHFNYLFLPFALSENQPHHG
jgi:hypothetical protein